MVNLIGRAQETVDRVDLQLLALLERDGRMSMVDLARATHRSESTIRDRVLALERRGVIKGYHARVDPDPLGLPCHVLLRADCRREDTHSVAKRLETIPQVHRAVVTTGEKPLLVELFLDSPRGLARLIESRLAPMGLERIHTEFVMETVVQPRPLSNASHLQVGETLPAAPSEARLPLRPLPTTYETARALEAFAQNGHSP